MNLVQLVVSPSLSAHLLDGKDGIRRIALVAGGIRYVEHHFILDKTLNVRRFAFLEDNRATLRKDKLTLQFAESPIPGSERLLAIRLRSVVFEDIHLVPVEPCDGADPDPARSSIWA